MSCKINFASSISPSAHTRRDFFLQLRKARERELATVDENRRAVGMLNPMRDKIEGTYRGEGTTPVTTACPEVEDWTYVNLVFVERA